MAVVDTEPISPTVDFRKLNPADASINTMSPVEQRTHVGRTTVRQQKESAARRVAFIITWTFAISAILLLIGTYRILRWQPTEAKTLLVDAGVPLLEKGGLFLSSTFGPLLAFVLGYYFGEKSDKGGSAE